ncbi:hypothetical protein [Pararhizobium sp. O133]|uniref:hypothetical protein n=1 Tax=Pararhizobium sp. O133 TaxID=3449278 RepID=UPI003F6884C7
MSDLYRPKKGLHVPMPHGQPDWPDEGRRVNFANPYEARLVRDGDIVRIENPAEGGKQRKNP